MTVIKEDVEKSIRSIYYFTAGDAMQSGAAVKQGSHPEDMHELGLVTFCVLILHSGFKVVGMSVPVDYKTFEATLGRDFAFDDAIDNLVDYLGFEKRQTVHRAIKDELRGTDSHAGDQP